LAWSSTPIEPMVLIWLMAATFRPRLSSIKS
jgi:hypothetical protein